MQLMRASDYCRKVGIHKDSLYVGRHQGSRSKYSGALIKKGAKLYIDLELFHKKQEQIVALRDIFYELDCIDYDNGAGMGKTWRAQIAKSYKIANNGNDAIYRKFYLYLKDSVSFTKCEYNAFIAKWLKDEKDILWGCDLLIGESKNEASI